MADATDVKFMLYFECSLVSYLIYSQNFYKIIIIK